MRIFPIIFICFYFLVLFTVKGKNGPTWIDKNIFDQKALIENKGQFFIEGKLPASEIKFGAVHEGLQYFFTKNAFYIENIKVVKRSEKEIEQLLEDHGIKENGESRKEKEQEFSLKQVKEYYQVQFIDVSSDLEIIPTEVQGFYYTYSDPNDVSNKTTITARAFKKITYKNIYPNIDLEFYFPDDKAGYKYNFILHPGSDVNDIKIKFENSEGLSLINENVIILSSFGSFVEHTPVSFVKNTNEFINSGFTLNGNIMGFKLNNHPKNEDIIIDPWVVTPSLMNGNRAYDVDYDDNGNVYIYGGGRPKFVLSKYDASGNLKWSYNCPALADMYGDFAVDKKTGTCYIGEGLDFLASFYKVNTLGIQVGFYNGSNMMNEVGRISFDPCTNVGYVVGGGSNGSGTRIAMLDTNMVSMNFIQHPTNSFCQDLNCLAIDNFGNSYQTTNYGWYNYNHIVKVPLSNLAVANWSVSNGYNFLEYGSNLYYKNQTYPSNGYNGISVSGRRLYTTNGHVLKKWNALNGALIDSLVMPIVPTGAYNEVFWGGIASNDCDYVLAGNGKNVLLYDPTLNLIQTYPQRDTVFDVVLKNDGTVYVCGDNFLSVFNITGINCISSTQSIIQPDSCAAFGTATVNVIGGTSPYSITWNTSPPQSGFTANNLSPGVNYLVTIQDNSCSKNSWIDTVKIINPGAYFSSVQITSVTCEGVNDGSIIVNCTGGVSPYYYSWSTGQNGVELNSISGLTVGNYSVLITDTKNCKHNLDINVPYVEAFSLKDFTKVNVFTPNDDGINDYFFPFNNFNSLFKVVDRFELNIYDRWGLLVFTTNKPKDYWVGRDLSGISMVAGTYFWIVTINSSCLNPVKQTEKGYVQLIR